MNQMLDKTDVKIRRHLMKFIPARLEELNMTEADISRATGDSPSQINRAVRGQNTPSLAFGLRLAEALQCSLDQLCGHEVAVNS